MQLIDPAIRRTNSLNELNEAITKYTGNSKYCQFIDIDLVDSYTRIIIDDYINKFEYEIFDDWKLRKKREQRINNLFNK